MALKKKYIKQADGDFKKAWKLQKKAENKKTSGRKKATKKKTAKKKTVKRKSPVKSTSKRKVVKRKVVRKKPVKRTIKKSNKRRKPVMAKKKKSVTKRRRPTMGKIQETLMYGALSAGGAVVVGMMANQIPIKDTRVKAFIPLLIGIGVGMTKIGSQKMLKPMVAGAITVGTLSVIKQFAPQVPMLAGEEEGYIVEQDMLGYDDDIDMLGEPVDVMGYEDEIDMLGETADEEDLYGEPVDVMGENDFITPADI